MDIDLSDNELPARLHEIVREANAKFSEISEAQEWAIARIRKLPGFATFRDTLADRAVCKIIADDRHDRNRMLKQEAGEYGKGPKIDLHRSPRMKAFHATLYDIAVAGTVLGQLLGEQIQDAANQERAIGNGHLVNARLLDRIAPLVPQGKRVRDCVPEKKIRTLLNQAKADALAA